MLRQMTTELNAIGSVLGESVLVFIVSIGRLSLDISEPRASQTSQAIIQFGGNPYVFDNLSDNGGGSHVYSLVGAVSPTYKNARPFPSVEACDLLTTGQPSGAVQGVLGRGRRSLFGPIHTDLTQGPSSFVDLYAIAWQAPVAWPQMDTPGKINAYKYLSKATSCVSTDTSPNCEDVRANKYTDFTDSNTPSNWLSNLNAIKNQCPSNQVALGFSCDEYAAVAGQLAIEYTYVSTVMAMHGAMELLMTEMQANYSLTDKSVATEVKKIIQPPPDTTVLFTIVNTILDFAGAGASYSGSNPAAAAVNVVMGLVNLAEGLSTLATGDPAAEIDDKVSQLEAQAAVRFPLMINGIDMLFQNILSDWGKLNVVGQHRDAEDTGWSWEDGKMLEVARLAQRRSYFRALLPLAIYGIYEVARSNVSQVSDLDCEMGVAPSRPEGGLHGIPSATHRSQKPLNLMWIISFTQNPRLSQTQVGCFLGYGIIYLKRRLMSCFKARMCRSYEKTGPQTWDWASLRMTSIINGLSSIVLLVVVRPSSIRSTIIHG